MPHTRRMKRMPTLKNMTKDKIASIKKRAPKASSITAKAPSAKRIVKRTMKRIKSKF